MPVEPARMGTSRGDAGAPGKRRLDRVLAADYLDGLDGLALREVRARRAEAEQEETDLSYLRRQLQGRADIVRAELARRSEGRGQDLLGALPDILDDKPAPPRSGRYVTLEPTQPPQRRRAAEMLVGDVEVSDVGERSSEELRAVLERLAGEEQTLSHSRRAVQAVMDACGAEIARRYRDGSASVADLLRETGES